MTARYPLMLDLTGRPVLVVGGGSVARRKVSGLIEAGAAVTVVAPRAVDEISEAAAAGQLTWARRSATAVDVTAQRWRLVVLTTDDRDLNATLAAAADDHGILVNDASAPDGGPAATPAVHRTGPVTVAVATGGTSPGAAAWLRDALADALPEDAVEALVLVDESRADWPGDRRPAWRSVLASGMLEHIREGREAEAKERLKACLS